LPDPQPFIGCWDCVLDGTKSSGGQRYAHDDGGFMSSQTQQAKSKGYIAKASTDIDAPASEVWRSLTEPELIKKYMFGADTETDWMVGSPITWKGEWEGKPFEDKGEVLAFEPENRLQYSHYSPMQGKPDTPDNYHTVTYDLSESDGKTTVSLTQDNNPDEKALEMSTQNWQTMLDGLKETVEA
jgi:uncharacterized protein YndB with AHSA1/START domain